MRQDWCSSTLRGVFQNAYFGVTQQIKGVGTTIFASIKHCAEKQAFRSFHFSAIKHAYKCFITLAITKQCFSFPAERFETPQLGKDTGGSVSQQEWLDILWCSVCLFLTFVPFFVKKYFFSAYQL